MLFSLISLLLITKSALSEAAFSEKLKKVAGHLNILSHVNVDDIINTVKNNLSLQTLSKLVSEENVDAKSESAVKASGLKSYVQLVGFKNSDCTGTVEYGEAIVLNQCFKYGYTTDSDGNFIPYYGQVSVGTDQPYYVLSFESDCENYFYTGQFPYDYGCTASNNLNDNMKVTHKFDICINIFLIY